MGQSSNTLSGGDRDKSDSCTTNEKVESPPQSSALSFPALVGVTDAERRHLILTPALAARLASALPSSFKGGTFSDETKWYLLYSSRLNGKSFQRFIQQVTSKGPTIIIIKVKGSPRVLGGFCESDWLTVAAREKNVRRVAAASTRATREKQKQQVIDPPANQNNVFFGNKNCFVFRAYADSVDDVCSDGEIYHAGTSMNSNFMYLFDTHPLEEKIGIGMGGQPGYYGWFIDRWLENGVSHGVQCTTFRNPRLTSMESWVVECVEAYAVRKDIVEQLLRGDDENMRGVSCVNENPESKCNQMLLELNGTHEFNRYDRTEC